MHTRTRDNKAHPQQHNLCSLKEKQIRSNKTDPWNYHEASSPQSHPKSPFKQTNNLALPKNHQSSMTSSRESYRIIGYRDIAPQYKAGFFFSARRRMCKMLPEIRCPQLEFFGSMNGLPGRFKDVFFLPHCRKMFNWIDIIQRGWPTNLVGSCDTNLQKRYIRMVLQILIEAPTGRISYSISR